MSDHIVKKLKKYFLFLSLLFFFLLGTHLVYSYVYSDSLSEAQQWGTVSEAIIGSFPHLNPLIPSNDHNAYINGLLYRSLLEYSTVSETLESDIAACNIENLLYIECVLENNLQWSDGTPITVEDIQATFNIITQTKVNPIVASLLENTTITTSDNTITFENNSKDINFLQVFLQPILKKSVVESLTTETVDKKFSETGWIYSWRFTLTNISQDETVGITKITLGKNDMYFGNDLYIQFLILNLYDDETHFLKNRNSFNIFNDKEWVIWNSIPRLNTYEYTLSQFVAAFLNTESISANLRSYILESIDRDTLIENIWEDKVLTANNPFLSQDDFKSPSSDINIWNFMKDAWYYSKKELLKSVVEAKKVSETVAPVKETKKPELVTPKQSDLKIITSPTTQKYNFTSDDNILIEWKVDEWVDAVYINDYKLEWFDAWDENFFYRLLESYDSIVEWENDYKVYYETNGEKNIVDEFVYIYHTDEEKLQDISDNFFSTPTENSEVTQETESPEKDSEKSESNTISTDLTVSQIESLSEDLFYNTKGEAYNLKLIYAQTDAQMELTASQIAAQLASVWIKLQLIPMSLWDITVGLRNENLSYDIILIWVNLWYFGSNIFPYFHSSQVANGYNFSNFKKLSVDILLEELKANTLSVTKQEELEVKLLDIIKEESIVKVLYTPKIKLLVDKNLKNFVLPKYLPDARHRYYPLIAAYLSEKREIQAWDKWLIWFVQYIVKTLFSN